MYNHYIIIIVSIFLFKKYFLLPFPPSFALDFPVFSFFLKPDFPFFHPLFILFFLPSAVGGMLEGKFSVPYLRHIIGSHHMKGAPNSLERNFLFLIFVTS